MKERFTKKGLKDRIGGGIKEFVANHRTAVALTIAAVGVISILAGKSNYSTLTEQDMINQTNKIYEQFDSGTIDRYEGAVATVNRSTNKDTEVSKPEAMEALEEMYAERDIYNKGMRIMDHIEDRQEDKNLHARVEMGAGIFIVFFAAGSAIQGQKEN